MKVKRSKVKALEDTTKVQQEDKQAEETATREEAQSHQCGVLRIVWSRSGWGARPLTVQEELE